MRDRQTGTTERVSVDQRRDEGNNDVSGASAISADGRFVAFDSLRVRTSYPATPTVNFDVFVHDRQTGHTELVSANLSGDPGAGFQNVISADGAFIAFASQLAGPGTG